MMSACGFAAPVGVLPAGAPNSLVQDGDRWVCLGDSITALNSYPPLLERVFRHYHPKANLTVINSGQGGDTAGDSPEKLADRVLKHKPTIVSIMYGMNEAINEWKPNTDKSLVQTRYRKALTYMARTLKKQGITVLLMSPTPTDPSAHSYFTLDKTVPFLRECAVIMREVAGAEGVYYVPVQEEFSTFQERLPVGVMLSPDGVHPASLGQYNIARSLWQFAGFNKPLKTGKRPTLKPDLVPSAPIKATLSSRFVKTDAAGVELSLTCDKPVTTTVTWSLGESRGQQKLELAAGSTPWKLLLPAALLPTRNGQSALLLMDFSVGNADNFYLLDLCRTAVLHLQNDKVSGVVETGSTPNRQIATWEAQRLGSDLLLNFNVSTSRIESNNVWPFARDGLNLMLDFRPTERFADIGVDREVTQAFLNVRDTPFFSVGLRAWTGLGMDFAAATAGGRTPDGYSAQMLIHDNFDLHTPVDIANRDFIGLLVGVAMHDLDSTKSDLSITTNQKNDGTVSLYANNLMILDLKNKIEGDAIINAYLTEAYVR